MKLLLPSSIFNFIDKLINFINSIFFLVLLLGLSFALIISPPDYLQGEHVRIMYVHVPSAWIALGIYSLITFLSISNFLFKTKNLFLISKSIAPIGLLFTCLAIITGSLWGQPTWGTWWAWDARLTSMLILSIFYILFIFSIKVFKKNEKCITYSSLIAIIGAVNLPIIKYSVNWWNTLHQKASIRIDGTIAIDEAMLIPLFLMLGVFGLYCALIFLMKYKTEIIKMKKNNLKRV